MKVRACVLESGRHACLKRSSQDFMICIHGGMQALAFSPPSPTALAMPLQCKPRWGVWHHDCHLPCVGSRRTVYLLCDVVSSSADQKRPSVVQAIDEAVRGTTSVTLTEYIIVFGCANLILAQCPHFHAIRYINAVATVCTISFSIIAVVMSIYSGECA